MLHVQTMKYGAPCPTLKIALSYSYHNKEDYVMNIILSLAALFQQLWFLMKSLTRPGHLGHKKRKAMNCPVYPRGGGGGRF